MATNTSEHLGLNLWEPDDQVLREEFNENWEKIDEETANIRADMADNLAEIMTAVGSGGGTARIAFGSYTGTGTYGADNPCSVTVGFRPLVFISFDPTYTQNSVCICTRGREYQPAFSERMYTIWGNDSFTWYSTYSAERQGNTSGNVYYYVILGDNLT